MTSDNSTTPDTSEHTHVFNETDDGKGGVLIHPDPHIQFPIRVELDDQGQDLLTLLIDSTGIIIDTNLQAYVWVGCEVHVGHLLETYESNPGEGCVIYRRDASTSGDLLKYRARQIYQGFPRETIHDN